MARLSDPVAAAERAAAAEADNPRPKQPEHDHPGDLSIAEAVDYAKQIVLWNIREIMNKVKPKADDPNLPERERESRVLANFERLLGRLVVREKQLEASKLSQKTGAELDDELVQGLTKLVER